jgi:hypothetical protein
MQVGHWFQNRTLYFSRVTGVPDRAEIIPIEPEPGYAGVGSVSMQSFRTPQQLHP